MLFDGVCKDVVVDVVIGNVVVNGFVECNGYFSLEGVGDVVVDIGVEWIFLELVCKDNIFLVEVF